jgi:hypothetical protein
MVAFLYLSIGLFLLAIVVCLALMAYDDYMDIKEKKFRNYKIKYYKEKNKSKWNT